MSEEYGDGMGMEPMYDDFDLSDKKSEKDLGKTVIAPGKYHCRVTRVWVTKKPNAETGDDRKIFNIQFKILNGSVQAMRGKTFIVNLYGDESSRTKRELWASRLGVIGKEDFGKKVRPDWARAAGKHAVVVMEENTFKSSKTGKMETNTQPPFNGVWPVTAEEVKDVPKDMEALAEEEIVLPDGYSGMANGPSATDDV